METYSYHFKDLQISRKIRRKWSWNLQTDLSTVQHYIEDGWYSSDRRSGQGAKNYQTEMATVIPSTKRWTQPCRGRLSRKRPNKNGAFQKTWRHFWIQRLWIFECSWHFDSNSCYSKFLISWKAIGKMTTHGTSIIGPACLQRLSTTYSNSIRQTHDILFTTYLPWVLEKFSRVHSS